MVQAKPFKIAIPEDALEDLHRRLKTSRLPTAVEEYGWNQGTPTSYLSEILAYWRNDYDWRARVRQLNGYEHLICTVEGVDIHVVRSQSGRGGIPLLMMHGWPSSFVQMLDILPLLSAPQDSETPVFDVIVAGLPGYPFAPLPNPHKMSFTRMAGLMTELMVKYFGHDRFAVRGSDQGGLVLQQMGLQFPERLIGLHRSGITPFANPVPTDLSAEEQAYLGKVQEWAKVETAYAQLQATRPETLIPALMDSPAGLASWYLEKFQRWGNCGPAAPDQRFGRDRLLDNLSLHWFAGSAASSTRLYLENAKDPGRKGRVEVPTAVMMPLSDRVTVPAPRSWCERSYNVQRFTLAPTCGHFAEWEEPAATAADIAAFFSQLS